MPAELDILEGSQVIAGFIPLNREFLSFGLQLDPGRGPERGRLNGITFLRAGKLFDATEYLSTKEREEMGIKFAQVVSFRCSIPALDGGQSQEQVLAGSFFLF